MKYNEIKISKDGTFFTHKGKKIFEKQFSEVLKFHSEGFAPVCDESGWYHINLRGEELYKERYDKAFGYYCGRASVVLNGKWFHLNTKGLKSNPTSYSWAGNYQENVCSVRNFNNNYFHINLSGERIYAENYLYTGDFKDGIACVKTEKGFHHIDERGLSINSKIFVDLGVFHKKYATAKDENGWFHIDKNGNELYKDRYLLIEPFYNGFSFVETFQNKKQIINEKGARIIEIN